MIRIGLDGRILMHYEMRVSLATLRNLASVATPRIVSPGTFSSKGQSEQFDSGFIETLCCRHDPVLAHICDSVIAQCPVFMKNIVELSKMTRVPGGIRWFIVVRQYRLDE